MPQPGGALAEKAIAVGPPVGEGRRHPGQHVAVGRFAVAVHESGDATHVGKVGVAPGSDGIGARIRWDQVIRPRPEREGPRPPGLEDPDVPINPVR